MSTQYPNHLIYLRQVNKNKWIIVFRRNNLSKKQFEYDYENEVYTYKETYNNNTNSHVSLKIIIKSKFFYDIFCAECNHFKANGGSNGFGISIQTMAMTIDEIMYKTVSKTIVEDTEFIKYNCSFKGTFYTYQLYNKSRNKLDKNTIYNKYKNNKITNKSSSKHGSKDQNKTIKDIPYEKIENNKSVIDVNIVKHCIYFENKICTYFNELCNPNSVRCKNPQILYEDKKKTNNEKDTSKTDISPKSIKPNHFVKAVVLSHNKKCLYNEHSLTDINAIIKVLIYNNKVMDITVPAAYCEECDQYLLLKKDFESIKQKGVLLCLIIDKTSEYIEKYSSVSYNATESKVHRLGYNVIKQCAYTYEQRKIILANIMENYNITQHEILSMLDANIARKISLPNYADAVNKWKQDREYVANYKHGDCPEVIINEVIIGGRSK